MISDLWSDIVGATVAGAIGVTAILAFLFTIIAVAIYRIREQLEAERKGEKTSSHAYLHDQESVNRFGEEPGEAERQRLVDSETS